jgi:hypothetical protein
VPKLATIIASKTSSEGLNFEHECSLNIAFAYIGASEMKWQGHRRVFVGTFSLTWSAPEETSIESASGASKSGENYILL